MKILIDTIGTVLNSTESGHKVKVVDDSSNTGGFLIYEWWEGSDGLNEQGAFDCWVQDQYALRSFFDEAEWIIEWST